MTELQKLTAQAIVNIFETGAVQGNYGAVTVIFHDPGHLTYGRSQASLASGNLYLLLKAYCDAPGAQCAAAISPFLDRLQQRDTSLDSDAVLHDALHQAAADPVMRTAQDNLFEAGFFTPACAAAAKAGLVTPLSQTLVYDSFVQGGWKALHEKVVGQLGNVGGAVLESAWVASYVDLRRQWLSSLPSPLPRTVYRMDSFKDLIAANKWDLELPLTVHGVTVDEAALRGEAAPRTLRLQTPNLTGNDVTALQSALAANGFPNVPDGVFGSTTDELVKAFQTAKGLPPDGVVGPRTRAALGTH